MKKICLLLSFLTIFYGCATNQFKDNYNDEGLKISRHHPTQIQIIETTDFQNKVLQYVHKGYVMIGSSHFEGEWEARMKAKKWAKKLGATLIIIGSQQTGTQDHQYVLAIPQINTTYHQGTIHTTGYQSGTMNTTAYTYGNIGNSNFNARTYGNGSYSGMSSYNTSYSGTSTSVSTSFISGSYKTAVFEQLAVFMIPKQYVEFMSENFAEENSEENIETKEEEHE